MQLSDKFHNIHWKNLITAVAIPLAVGGLSAWITKDGMKAFEAVNQPPLTPPMWLFPVVWSILFVLMGIASYLVVMQKGEDTKALTLYAVQLIFNFFWSICHFRKNRFKIYCHVCSFFLFYLRHSRRCVC